jgi:dihydrofolate synthase/folylpolyglutamate synthase
MRFGSRLGLGRIKALLNLLLPNGLNTRFLHIAGTNGKGSVTAMISSILQRAGYTTGQYTSPYLEDFRERIQVNGKMIPKEDLVKLTALIKDKISRLEEHPTEFEIVTALGFLHFVESNCDYVSLEVGLGGRYDATNVITPEVSVITTISFDHMEQLGNTLGKIAYEKAGIIKPGVPVVTGAVEDEPLEVISRVARDLNANLITVGKDNTCDVKWREVSSNIDSQLVDVIGSSFKYEDLLVNLPGRHQQQNAAIAIAAIKSAQIPIDENAIREGLGDTYWPGRLESLSYKPRIVLDGAHNAAGAIVLSDFLKRLPKRRLIMVYGVLQDKSHKEITQTLVPFSDTSIVTKPDTPRALDPYVLAREVQELCSDVKVIPSIEDALDTALNLLSPDDVLLVCGSLYLVGPARTHLRRRLGIS